MEAGPRRDGRGRTTRIASVFWLFAALTAGPVQGQERTFCAAGAPGAPAIYIDSTASEVIVVTTDGRQLVAARNLLLCPGDEVRTGVTGRVAIRFEEKRTVVRLDGSSRTRVLAGGTGTADISLLSGVLYFISSVRRRFEVDTPYIVAGIEGTEALVLVQPAGALAMAAVREGLVSAYDRQYTGAGVLAVSSGEAAFRSAAVPFQSAPISDLPPPFRDLLIVSDSAVDWAVYYPPILLVRDAQNQAIRDALILLGSGDYERAEAALEAADDLDPATTAALRTIIAVARNRLAEAERWSRLALDAGPDLAAAHVAASYVRQAEGDLDGALASAAAAVEVAPNDAYAIARLAELQMTVGDRRAALANAERSLVIERLPLALFVAGLARLSAWQYDRAEALFEEAIRLDPEAPLPRLGLGLAFIRQGDVAGGAWEIERAVAHDPRRASLRTWLGRAYFDEELRAKAAEELRIAKAEDPNDPTPYLFSALERFAANRPIEALRELQEANRRGDARRVLRSERGLGEDAATRGAALGRIYDVLGFEQLAVVEGAKAVDADPSNPAAHRFLADAYRQRPGYEIAQTSELLRSQLLSPPSKTPVQPQLAEADLALLDTTGPSRVTFAEFAPLFDADGLRLDASGLLGTQDTWGDEVAVTGLYRGASVSFGQFHYETDGFRENNDLTHDIVNAIGTFALSPEFSLFGEYRFRESEGGDRRIDFNIDDFVDTLRSERQREVARAGFHAQPTVDSDLIGLYTWANLQTGDQVAGGGGELDTQDREDDANGVQAQHIWQPGWFKNVSGGAYIHNDVRDEFSIGPTNELDHFSTHYFSAYDYFYLELPERVSWTLGGAVVSFDTEDVGPFNARFDVVEFLPKIGVSAKVLDNVTVRAVYLRNLRPELVSEQVIEPTTVAGFSQFYDTLNTSVLEQLGGGIDINVTPSLLVGGEAIRQWWHVPLLGVRDPETEERILRAYAYVTLTNQLALSAELVDERSTSDLVFEDFAEWRTTSVPVTLSYFSPSGFFGTIGGEFVDHSFDDFGVTRSDSFTLINASAGYRFPGSKGAISVEARNLFDERVHYQNRGQPLDITAKPRYAPERVIQVRGTVRF